MSEPTVFHRFYGCRAWLDLSDVQRAAIGELALEFVLVLYLQELEGRGPENALSDFYARVAVVADGLILPALENLVRESLPEDAFRAPDGNPRVPSLLGGICRGCGCSHHDPCDEGCGWAAEDRCTACAGKAKAP